MRKKSSSFNKIGAYKQTSDVGCRRGDGFSVHILNDDGICYIVDNEIMIEYRPRRLSLFLAYIAYFLKFSKKRDA